MSNDSPGQFKTTQWSLVLSAGRRSTPDAQTALSTLCQTYWAPLYAYVRRHCGNLLEAQDLTQEFFTRLLEGNYIGVANPSRGRFRSFLITTLKHFLVNEWKKANTQQRGGGKRMLSLDFASVDASRRFEPTSERTPEQEFDRDWAKTLINHVLNCLQQEHVSRGQENQFDQLKQFLSGAGEGTAHRKVAESLGMTEGAVRTAAHRLRKRYRELLREEIARTVTTPEEVEEEIHNLFTVLGS